MATYKLTIEVDAKILETNSKDNLCIAKKVNGKFTTTFQGASITPVGNQHPVLEVNNFRWTEKYQVFLGVHWKAGMEVSASTKPMPIKFGEETTFSGHLLSPAQHADPSQFIDEDSAPDKSFLALKVPQTLKAGVYCESNGKPAPIYVDPDNHVGLTNKQLTPINQYSLFWDSRITTDTMIDYTKTTHPYEFSFADGETALTIRYGYKIPNAPSSPSEEPRWY